MSPLFSIIVPVYNAQQFLHQCIDSILHQSFADFELILVNDGSKDNSLSICQDYEKKDSRIKVVNQDNTGVSGARNKGIGNANGRYVLFVDSDDFVDSAFLSGFKTLIDEGDYDLLIGGFTKFFGESHPGNCAHNVQKQSGSDKKEIGKLIPVLEKQSLLSGPFAKCFKRNIILENNVTFDPTFHFGEDAIFNLNYVLHIQSIATTPVLGYYYVQRDSDSLVKRKYPFNITNMFSNVITDIREKLIAQFDIDNDLYKSIVAKERTLYKVNAILSMYLPKFKENRKRRLEILKQELTNIDIKSLPGSSVYYKIISFIFGLKSPLQIDVSLGILTFIMNRENA